MPRVLLIHTSDLLTGVLHFPVDVSFIIARKSPYAFGNPSGFGSIYREEKKSVMWFGLFAREQRIFKVIR